MNQESISEILQYLDKVAVKLGVGVDYLWPLFVKQQYIEAYYCAGLFVIFAIIFVPLMTFTVRHWDPSSGYSIYDNDQEFIFAMACAISSTSVVVGLIMFLSEFIDIFNPEYAAIKDIIKMSAL